VLASCRRSATDFGDSRDFFVANKPVAIHAQNSALFLDGRSYNAPDSAIAQPQATLDLPLAEE
jgi:hypothetical protein